MLVGAILLGGIFAKVISTANNYLFSPATNLIHDVYERFINPDASERRTLIVSRVLVIGLGVFALLQATQFRIDAECGAVRVHGVRRGGDAGGDGGILLEAGHYGGRHHLDRAGDGGHGRLERRAGDGAGNTIWTRCIRRWAHRC